MKLWKESDVLPFKSREGIRKYKKRKKAGKKASETRKKLLKEWFTEIKSANPRVKEIVKRLWEIGEKIAELHDLKEECRESDPKYDSSDYWEAGIEHCKDCEEMSKEQSELREERNELFSELEEICEKDKRTIQLARKLPKGIGTAGVDLRTDKSRATAKIDLSAIELKSPAFILNDYETRDDPKTR